MANPLQDKHILLGVTGSIACYKAAETKKWEPVEIKQWRGSSDDKKEVALKEYNKDHYLIKEEKMPNGNLKIILKDKKTGAISQVIQT